MDRRLRLRELCRHQGARYGAQRLGAMRGNDRRGERQFSQYRLGYEKQFLAEIRKPELPAPAIDHAARDHPVHAQGRADHHRAGTQPDPLRARDLFPTQGNGFRREDQSLRQARALRPRIPDFHPQELGRPKGPKSLFCQMRLLGDWPSSHSEGKNDTCLGMISDREEFHGAIVYARGSDCNCDRALSFYVSAGKATVVAREVPDPQRADRTARRTLVRRLRAGPMGADPDGDPYRRGNDREHSVGTEGVINGGDGIRKPSVRSGLNFPSRAQAEAAMRFFRESGEPRTIRANPRKRTTMQQPEVISGKQSRDALGSDIQSRATRGRVKDAPSGHWVYRVLPTSLWSYAQLARWDRPIGWQLLLWPCWWSAAMVAAARATPGDGAWAVMPSLWHLFLFLVGAIAMRGAGCAYNDLVDQDIDDKVDRTRSRAARPRRAVAVQLVFSGARRGLADHRRDLSLHEAHHRLATVRARHGFFVGRAGGLGRGGRLARPAAAPALCRRDPVDHRLRYDLRPSGQGGRRAGRRALDRAPVRPAHQDGADFALRRCDQLVRGCLRSGAGAAAGLRRAFGGGGASHPPDPRARHRRSRPVLAPIPLQQCRRLAHLPRSGAGQPLGGDQASGLIRDSSAAPKTWERSMTAGAAIAPCSNDRWA
ncbi:hypothetical protein Lal_00015646 [Lupinus albus]|nr:hypothetical protein Lal_00015646 [Lupinus albus]